MGLGPSIKMTTLHHFNCPITRQLRKEEDLDFAGIIVDGVSEVFDDKVYTARRVSDIALAMRVDGAIVSIDGWGNHHVDFVNVIEQLGLKNIPCVGLSFIGQQGRLVCNNKYVDCIVDFNKNESGYENCVVGDNNMSDVDVYKAIGLLKNKLRKAGKFNNISPDNRKDLISSRLIFKKYRVKDIVFADNTSLSRGILTLDKNKLESYAKLEKSIKELKINIIRPDQKEIFVNSNLDFSPIACKLRGELGQGITHLLDGVCLMINGVEDGSGFQPSNIGSSEGILSQAVKFDVDGTPKSDDFIIQIDISFHEGEGRSNQGIMAGHRVADLIVNQIRETMKKIQDMPYEKEEFIDYIRVGKPRIILVKIVSGLGNMYDTNIFPLEPGGFIGSRSMRLSKNIPYVISPNQCKDGAIHSLL